MADTICLGVVDLRERNGLKNITLGEIMNQKAQQSIRGQEEDFQRELTGKSHSNSLKGSRARYARTNGRYVCRWKEKNVRN